MKPRLVTPSIIVALFLLCSSGPAFALWTTDGRAVEYVPRPDVLAAYYSVPDGAGGSIACWTDYRNGNNDIYAQRIDPQGHRSWVVNGIGVSTGDYSQFGPVAAPDGSGGAVIVWKDSRLNGNGDFYAQRVDSTGNVLWTAGGVPVVSTLGWNLDLTAIPDGYGGTLIAWREQRGDDTDIYAQRISPGGTPRWGTNGVAVCEEAADQEDPRIVTDGAGGMIAAWSDRRLSGYPDIYAQRVDSTGTAVWPAGGHVICDATGTQLISGIVETGSGAAIITWTDSRGADTDIYAQRINFLGLTAWTNNGVLVCGATGWQGEVCITPDGAAGAYFAWRDQRSDADIYAQRISSVGSAYWATDGIPVCTTGVDCENPAITTDGAGGVIVTWNDSRSSNDDIYAARINSSGTHQWTAGGEVVCDYTGTQAAHFTVPDYSGGAVVCWLDKRVGKNEIYAQRIDSNGDRLWYADGVVVVRETFDLYAGDIVYDEDGGAIICWADKRYEGLDIYVQRMDSTGINLWGGLGKPLCVRPETQAAPRMVGDGAGGAIVVWMDRRAGNFDLYAQRIQANGTVLWTAGGVVVSDNAADQMDPVIVGDGAGGAIVAWYDDRSGNFDVYAQRLGGSGNRLWGSGGKVVCSAVYPQQECGIVADGSGGAVITWRDLRNSYWDIYTQRLGGDGTALWTADGVPVCVNGYTTERIHTAADGSGGVLVTWQDDRDTGDNVIVQRVDSGGNVRWTTTGTAVTSFTAADQRFPRVATDARGGAVVVWQDHRNAYHDIFAQRVDSTGTTAWGTGGLAVCDAMGNQDQPHVVSDNTGGVVVTWTDERDGPQSDIYAGRVGPTGVVEWKIPAGGIPICTDGDYQYEPRITTDGFRGGLIVWSDRRRTGEYFDLYAQRIEGPYGVVMPVSLDFGMVPVLGSGVEGFSIYNVGDLTLSDSLTVVGPYYSIVGDITGYAVDPGWQYLVEVQFDPVYEGVYAGTVGTGTNTSGAVSCTATAYGPDCDVNPTGIDLPGLVRTGGFCDTSFTIVNTGGGILNGNVGESSGQYSIVSGAGPFLLYQWDTLRVDVRFEPAVPGTHVCVVETGVYACGDVTITGTAFACPSDSILYVDGDAAGAGDGTSWTNAFVSLQDALARAALCEDVREIWVADGTYYPTAGSNRDTSFVLVDSLAIYGGFDGTETALEQRDLLVNRSVLCGDIGAPGDDSDNSYNVVAGRTAGPSAVLDGFTIRDGNASRSVEDGGGGMYLAESSPTIRNVIFRNNRTTGTGGAVLNQSANPTMINVLFCHNSADGFGGAMFNYQSSPVLTNCTFSVNSSGSIPGGMFNEEDSDPVLTNVVMWGDDSAGEPEIANHNDSDPLVSFSLIQDCGGSGGGWNAGIGIDGGHNMDEDPLFIDGAGCDLHLGEASPAIDAGDNTAPGISETDLDGKQRIQDKVVDMGAYEGAFNVVRIGVETATEPLGVIVDGDTLVSPTDFFTRSGAVHEIGTWSPQTEDEKIYSFVDWSDSGDIIHAITAPTSDATYTATFTWAYTCAFVDSVVDVPGDQGGWVRLYFRRSHYDRAGEPQYPIERYDIHRRVDNPALIAAILAEHQQPAGAPPGVWEVVATVSAQQQEQYIALAPTLADSAATLTYTAYYISAHSTTPATFFDSPVDSGYSVDNIAPGVPEGFTVAYNTGSGNQLSWDASTEPDFQYYRIYRGSDPDFTPGPENVVHATADPYWTDTEYDGWDVHYKVTAVDHAGNESPPASPGTATGAGAETVPTAFALRANVPNPFNPATTIHYDVPPGGGVVRIRIYDVAGRLVRTLVDSTQPAGRRSVRWDGTGERGSRVASGLYFCRMTAPGFDATRKMILLQ